MFFQAFWTDEKDAILTSCTSSREAADRLGVTQTAAKIRLRRLREAGKTKHHFNRRRAGVFAWTAERDAILLASKTRDEAVDKLGCSPGSATNRLCELRKAGATDKFFAAPRKGPAKNTKAWWEAKIEKEIQSGPYVPRKECSDFLTALALHERPPVEVAVRDRQPLMHNPSLFQGSGCSSSAAMD